MSVPLQKGVPIVNKEGLPTQYFLRYLLQQNTFSGTVTTAKLTAGGSNGSMVFQNGQLISQVPAT